MCQGSVLGPLLFDIFINNLFFFVENSDVCNSADSITLAFADISVEQIIKALETDITKLYEWFISNGLLVNDTNCQLLLIEPCIRDDLAEVQVCGKMIFKSTHGKLLGITIDRNINMKDHIKNLCRQAGKKT